jgi:hypothetical protein
VYPAIYRQRNGLSGAPTESVVRAPPSRSDEASQLNLLTHFDFRQPTPDDDHAAIRGTVPSVYRVVGPTPQRPHCEVESERRNGQRVRNSRHFAGS